MNSYPYLEPPTKPGDLGQLGHYRVIDELGKGGMGHVFRAEDVKLKRAVALKVMNRKIAATPHSRRRFIHEARAMAAVHHDNVATIFEVGESKGTPFMAMEMLRGSTLEVLNESKRRLSYDEIIELARQMSKGLAAAHAKGIVHRDIKPANIWIEQDTNRVKILDFGLALASSPVDHLAGRGAVVGTPGYLSPEQAMSEPLDDRSDLYSLGVVLYELCTGRLPSDAKSVPAQLIAILVHRPTPIGELNPEIPSPLCDLIHRLLRKEPRSRPESAKLLLEQLDRVETECHVKSDVAQTISKLQLGLQAVVNKQSSKSIFELEAVPDSHPDPLAVSPAPPALTVPVTMVPARPTAIKPVAPPAPAWQTYWPLAAVVAAVLITLPLLTFLFAGLGRSTRGALIVDDSVGSTISPSSTTSSPATIARSTADSTPDSFSGNTAPTPGPLSVNNRRDNSPNLAARQTSMPDSRDALDTDRPRKSGPAKGRGKVNSGSDAGQYIPGTSSHPGMIAPSAPAQLASAALPSPFEPSSPVSVSVSPGAGASPTVPPAAPPVPGRPEMKWTSISTADGRGADAMVQVKSTQRFGLNLSLGVRTRSGVENNHSYLRFDLAGVEQTRRWTDSAELVLTVVGEERPVGATVRVFAVNAGLWPEDRLDWETSYFSPRGLESLPLLADITVGPDADPKDAGFNVIRISSPQFVDAIARSTQDTMTLVLAGSGAENSMLRFVSREQSASAAPRLVIRTPVAPPEQPQSRRGGRGGANRPIP